MQHCLLKYQAAWTAPFGNVQFFQRHLIEGSDQSQQELCEALSREDVTLADNTRSCILIFQLCGITAILEWQTGSPDQLGRIILTAFSESKPFVPGSVEGHTNHS